MIIIMAFYLPINIFFILYQQFYDTVEAKCSEQLIWGSCQLLIHNKVISKESYFFRKFIALLRNLMKSANGAEQLNVLNIYKLSGGTFSLTFFE